MAERTAYDEPTEEELRLMDQAMADAPVPPVEDDDSKPITPAQVAEEAGQKPEGTDTVEGAAAPATAPDGAPAKPEPTEDEKFAAFMEQHKGKSPEELARLAFQQQGRANQAGFAARQANEASKRIQDALGQIAERRKGLSTKRTEFDQQLQEDPDAATRRVHDELLTAEEQALAEQEFTLKRDHMVTVAAQVIPDFHIQAPEIAAFAAELNYTQKELADITDPRDMVTLWMAKHTGRLMKAGIMDFNGNIDVSKLPTPVAATDPRLQPGTKPIQTLGSAPARTADGAKTLEQQLGEIAAMDEATLEAFDKANPGVVDNLLRQAG